MAKLRDDDRRLLGFAREMRKASTDAEMKIWSLLRDRALGGFKFRRQYAVAGYILDFYCVRRKFAVELDGGQHSEYANAKRDIERTKRLNALGIRVVRFWDHDVLRDSGIIAEEILRHLQSEDPHPGPLPDYQERGE
jgi:very-short-patch-repair endonuclease